MMEIEPTGLDFHEWSPAFHVWHVGGTCFPPYPSHSVFSALTPSTLNILFTHSQLSYALTQHSSHR